MKPCLDPSRWPDAEKEVIAAILPWLDQEFDREGFRNIELCEAEWNFSGLSETGDLAAEFACRHEYGREVALAYEYQRDLLLVMQRDTAPETMRSKWPAMPLPHFTCVGVFPLPWMLIPVEHRTGGTRTTVPPVWEIDAEQFGRPCFGQTHHRLEINWRHGVDAVETALLKWVRAIRPPDAPTRRQRPERKLIEDRLAQLAAWRARRAGLAHGEFARLVKDAGAKSGGYRGYLRAYADPSAFRNAADAAQREIERLQREAKTRLKR